MSEMQDQYQQAQGILKNAFDELSEVITEPQIATLKTRLLMNLQRDINFLAIQSGGEPIKTIQPLAEGAGAPLRRFLGRDINPPASKGVSEPITYGPALDEGEVATSTLPASHANATFTPPYMKTGQQLEAEELAAKLEELYPKFNTIDTEGILDTYSDIEILGIGKMAGLPVSATQKVNKKFVEQVKGAIVKQAELKQLGETGTTKQDPAANATGTTTDEAANGSTTNDPAK